MSLKAVITGDIINSTAIEIAERERLLKKLVEFLKDIDNTYDVISETFRGDSFQCFVHNPSTSLKIALLQKTFLLSLDKSKNYDARIAIGIGKVDSLSEKLTISNGEAFELSGQLLDSMKKGKQSLAINSNDNYNDELKTEGILLDAIISKATALQCEVIYQKLLGNSEIQIAEKLKISQSAVNQHSNSGNWNAIDAMLKRFEKIYANEK